jgi:hypothetical protein
MKIEVTIEGYISNVSSKLDTHEQGGMDNERSLAIEWFCSLLDAARIWDQEETQEAEL